MFTSTDRIMGLSTLAANNTVHADLFRQAHANMLKEDTATISPIPVHRGPRQLGQTVARLMNDLARQSIVKRTRDPLVLSDVDSLQEIVEEVRGV
jgi:hypothetical protein